METSDSPLVPMLQRGNLNLPIHRLVQERPLFIPTQERRNETTIKFKEDTFIV